MGPDFITYSSFKLANHAPCVKLRLTDQNLRILYISPLFEMFKDTNFVM